MKGHQLIFEEHFQDEQLLRSSVDEADPQLAHARLAARTHMKSRHSASVDIPPTRPPAFSSYLPHTTADLSYLLIYKSVIYRSKSARSGKTKREQRENDLQTKQ